MCMCTCVLWGYTMYVCAVHLARACTGNAGRASACHASKPQPCFPQPGLHAQALESSFQPCRQCHVQVCTLLLRDKPNADFVHPTGNVHHVQQQQQLTIDMSPSGVAGKRMPLALRLIPGCTPTALSGREKVRPAVVRAVSMRLCGPGMGGWNDTTRSCSGQAFSMGLV